jgi:hypothetical protein
MAKIKVGTETTGLDYILFEVEVRDEIMPSNKEYSKRVVGQINGGDFLLNQCSDVYKLVKNADVFPNIEKVLESNDIEFEVEYKHIKHVRFYADYKITDKEFAYSVNGTNDVIMPMLRVQHSYNGLTKYRIMFGYFRMICTNGLTIPVAEMNEFNLVIIGKHTEQIVHSFAELDVMLVNFGLNAKTITKAITDKYEILARKTVTNTEARVREVLEAVKIAVVENNKFNTINYILARIDAESMTLGCTVNDWLVYNAINAYIFDERNVSVPEKRMELDSKMFEYILETV